MQSKPIAERSYSALMPANLITLAHVSISSAMTLPKSAGEPTSTAVPSSVSYAFILGSAKPALISGHLIARHEIAHSREVRQHVRSCCSGYRQRAQLAGPY